MYSSSKQSTLKHKLFAYPVAPLVMADFAEIFIAEHHDDNRYYTKNEQFTISYYIDINGISTFINNMYDY